MNKVTNNDMLESRLLTVEKVARFLGCSAANVYGLIDSGALPFVSIGIRKGYRIDIKDIESFIQDRKQHKSQQSSPAPRPKLKHLRLPPR